MIWTSGNKLCNVGHTGLSNKGSSANNINNNNNQGNKQLPTLRKEAFAPASFISTMERTHNLPKCLGQPITCLYAGFEMFFP